jgi:phosphomannomutase / phosphoglucomutase
VASKKSELATFGQLPLLCLVGGFVITLLLSLFLVRTLVSSDHRVTLIANHADSYQQQLNIKQHQLQTQLINLAANSRLVDITSGGDPNERSIEEVVLRELIPDAIRVRIFTIGEAEIDRTSIPPFSFTSLDLVNRVETGESVYPEAINANGRWIVSVASPIKSSERIVGTLFVYLEMSALTASLEENIDGEVIVRQKVGNATPQDVLLIGSGKSPEVASVERALDNPNWTAHYSPSAAIASQTAGALFLYIIPAVTFLILGLAGVFLGLRKTIELIKNDVGTLELQLRDAVAGDHNARDDYTVGSFIELDRKLASLGARKPAAPISDTLSVEDKVAPQPAPASEIVDIEMADDEPVDDELEEPLEDIPEEFDASAIEGIFRAYDIRGVVDETLTEEAIYRIGLAIGSEAEAQGEQSLVVGADGRTSSPAVLEPLIKGLVESGRDVINIGSVPTPVLYFATENSDTRSGVMITGSHNPPEYNGFKIVIDGRTLVEDDIRSLYVRVRDNDFTSGEGELTEIDILDDYMDAILDDVVVAQPLKVVVDCGNGIAGEITPDILSNLGCDVVPLYCDVDGTFPNHHPDPTIPANLDDLILTVRSQEADLGIALDGDGDRLVAVTSAGDIVWPDRLLMLFAKDVVSRNPGSDVVYDVKCTRHLNSVISGFGGRPIICRSGHSFVKEKIAETDAVLGGEMSGHICFGERWFGFDDGIYAASRLIEIVGAQTEGLAELLAEFPDSISTPEILVAVEEENKFDIIEALEQTMDFGDGTMSNLDGIRVDFADGWGLIRASNTNPNLTLRFEADDQAALNRIRDQFKAGLQSIRSDLDF